MATTPTGGASSGGRLLSHADAGRLAGRVRALVDWDALVGRATVERVVVHNDTRRWWTPWYTHAGRRCGWDHPEGRPTRVGEAAAGVAALADECGAALDELAGRLRREGARFEAVTYSWGTGDTIVLDGNHRLVAAARGGIRWQGVQVRLAGALDPAAVADCTWFARGGTG